MEIQRVVKTHLNDGHIYTGWGNFENGIFIPNGCGKKYYEDYYVYGNFNNGIIEGPAIVSHNNYMHTQFFKNNKANGWGLCINRGELVEFGYYKDGILQSNLIDFVSWYFRKMQLSDRVGEDMLHMYTFNSSKKVAELIIGYTGTQDEYGIGLCYMGFRFTPNGSVWVGNTVDRKYSGKLIHFREDGLIDAGEFLNGNLFDRMSLQSIIDEYYGTYNEDDFSELDEIFKISIPQKEVDPEMEYERNKYKDINDIIPNHNYFVAQSQSLNQEKNKMEYYVNEIALFGSSEFKKFDDEIWIFDDKQIKTPHGDFNIINVHYVEQGKLVGFQFEVQGVLDLNTFSCSNGAGIEVPIKTFALMRQPHNAWVWAYTFDQFDRPMANFCGHDKLDGMAKYEHLLKLKFK